MTSARSHVLWISNTAGTKRELGQILLVQRLLVPLFQQGVQPHEQNLGKPARLLLVTSRSLSTAHSHALAIYSSFMVVLFWSSIWRRILVVRRGVSSSGLCHRRIVHLYHCIPSSTFCNYACSNSGLLITPKQWISNSDCSTPCHHVVNPISDFKSCIIHSLPFVPRSAKIVPILLRLHSRNHFSFYRPFSLHGIRWRKLLH